MGQVWAPVASVCSHNSICSGSWSCCTHLSPWTLMCCSELGSRAGPREKKLVERKAGLQPPWEISWAVLGWPEGVGMGRWLDGESPVAIVCTCSPGGGSRGR